MGARKIVERRWIEALIAGEAQLRCFYRRRGKTIDQFTVQVELNCNGVWKPLVRYDNAHGFSHRDILHADGSQEKTAIYMGNMNETFTYAITDLKGSWRAHRDRYLGEMQT
jgi:hypothetical protein